MSRLEPRRSDACAATTGGAPRAALLILLAFIGGCGAKEGAASRPAKGVVVAEELSPSDDGLALLSRYPQSPALRSTRDTYAASSGGRGSIFMTTWFPGPDARVGEWSTIDSRGRVTIYRFVHDFGFQDSRTTSLVESQVPELPALLQTLPPSSPPPTLNRLLIVGFRRSEGVWDTRLYDRTDPPSVVKRVFREMTGAPLE